MVFGKITGFFYSFIYLETLAVVLNNRAFAFEKYKVVLFFMTFMQRINELIYIYIYIY